MVVNLGNDPADLADFETWLGRPVDGVQLHTGKADWKDWSGSIGWLGGQWAEVGRRLYWSIPLFPVGANLQDAAAGAYDAHYRDAVAQLVALQPEGPINLRTGWEFNGTWFPWAAHNDPQAFAEAFARFSRIARSASDRFVVQWTANIGDHGMNPELAYPGDDVVDVIGMDFYFDPKFYGTDPDAAWQRMLTEPYGLEWLRDFAAKHGKPVAYPEWGVTLDTSGPFIEKAAAWFQDTGVLYDGYWNSNAAFRGKLDDGRVPAAAAVFRQEFSPGG